MCFALALASLQSNVIAENSIAHTTSVSDFGKIYSAQASSTFEPTSTEEVQAIVIKALQDNRKIGVAGAQMSQGGHTLPGEPEGFFISSKKMNIVQILPEEKIARVGPGATWKDIQNKAYPFGLAVKVMQASNIFSVGGSISTNIHGWDHIEGSLSETLRTVTIVDANGNIVKLKPNDELFGLVVGGYGMFGIIVEAEIELADDVTLIRQLNAMPIEEYNSYYSTAVEPDSSMKLHYAAISLDPYDLFGNVTAINFTETQEMYPRKAILVDEPEKGHFTDRLAITILRKYPRLILLKRKYEESFQTRESVMTRNEAMRPAINFILSADTKNGDMLQEYFVPKENLVPFLKELKVLIEKHGVNLFNATIRHVKKDTLTAMPYAKTDVFAIVLYYYNNLEANGLENIQDFTRKAIDLSIKYGGTYYLPYHRFHTLEQLDGAYPERKHIIEKKSEYDPGNIFFSQFAEQYFKL
jgi:FAD/FMN-containing dehydrogenase